MNWKINGDIIKTSDENVYILGKKTIKLSNLCSQGYLLIKRLEEGVEETFLMEAKKNDAINSILSQLTYEDLLVPYTKEYENTLLEKTYIYYLRKYGTSKETYILNTKATVVILGCGGIGAGVAIHLARSGINNFILIDNDVVELSNINRQIPFTKSDIGISKVDCLAVHLKNIINVSVECISKKINSYKDISDLLDNKKIDFIVSAIDNPPVLSNQWIAKYASICNVPVIFGGVGVDEGYYGPILYKKIDYINYIEQLKNAVNNLDNDHIRPTIGSTSWNNGVIASYISGEILQFLFSCYKEDYEFSRKHVSFY